MSDKKSEELLLAEQLIHKKYDEKSTTTFITVLGYELPTPDHDDAVFVVGGMRHVLEHHLKNFARDERYIERKSIVLGAFAEELSAFDAQTLYMHKERVIEKIKASRRNEAAYQDLERKLQVLLDTEDQRDDARWRELLNEALDELHQRQERGPT